MHFITCIVTKMPELYSSKIPLFFSLSNPEDSIQRYTEGEMDKNIHLTFSVIMQNNRLGLHKNWHQPNRFMTYFEEK